jgi:hypothetical protein
MLPDFGSFQNVWVEITSSENEHGGAGWAFGDCLWSPVRDRAGRLRYETMLLPQVGDLVLHFYKYPWEGAPSQTRLCGLSIIQAACQIVYNHPPNPGEWLSDSYYRINLTDYQELSNRLFIDGLNQLPEYVARIREELVPTAPERYPLNTRVDGFRVVQGLYLRQCTENLYHILDDALGVGPTLSINPMDSVTHVNVITAPAASSKSVSPAKREAQEGVRRMRETYFFTRNRKLALDAKKLRNYVCEACNFDFCEMYGEYGQDFAECHHKNPLSERSEELWTKAVTTTLADVAVLCANCHRMIHRERPAISIEKLRDIIAAAKKV